MLSVGVCVWVEQAPRNRSRALKPHSFNFHNSNHYIQLYLKATKSLIIFIIIFVSFMCAGSEEKGFELNEACEVS